MELARNPSDINITNWISYNNKKNLLNERLQKRMREYLSKRSKLTPKVERIIRKNSIQTKTTFDPSRYRVRMYFSSTCPHCKRMFDTLLALQNRGIFVEAMQIDSGTFKKAKFPIPVSKASKEEIKSHGVKSVPFTLIADLKRKVLFPPIQGFQSEHSLIDLIKKGETL